LNSGAFIIVHGGTNNTTINSGAFNLGMLHRTGLTITNYTTANRWSFNWGIFFSSYRV